MIASGCPQLQAINIAGRRDDLRIQGLVQNCPHLVSIGAAACGLRDVHIATIAKGLPALEVCPQEVLLFSWPTIKSIIVRVVLLRVESLTLAYRATPSLPYLRWIRCSTLRPTAR